MQSLSDDDRKQALGEVLFDELRAIREILKGQPTRVEFNELKGEVAEIKSDVRVIKQVVKDHSKQLNNHEQRLGVPRSA